jgi:hypothetical protein
VKCGNWYCEVGRRIKQQFHGLGIFRAHRKIESLLFLDPRNPQRQWQPLYTRPGATFLNRCRGRGACVRYDFARRCALRKCVFHVLGLMTRHIILESTPGEHLRQKLTAMDDLLGAFIILERVFRCGEIGRVQ